MRAPDSLSVTKQPDKERRRAQEFHRPGFAAPEDLVDRPRCAGRSEQQHDPAPTIVPSDSRSCCWHASTSPSRWYAQPGFKNNNSVIRVARAVLLARGPCRARSQRAPWLYRQTGNWVDARSADAGAGARAMNVFELRRRQIREYEQYVRSFMAIRDERVEAECESRSKTAARHGRKRQHCGRLKLAPRWSVVHLLGG